jgi:hypothetical protein
MKKLMMLLAVAVLACGVLGGCGMVDTYQERNRRIQNINDLQARMFMDDWDYFWLYERNTYLTEWFPHVAH